MVNLRNDGVLPFLPDDHVIEVPAVFRDGGFVAEPVAPLPDDIRGLIAGVAGHPTSAGGDDDAAEGVLALGPGRHAVDRRQRVVDDLAVG